jgi:hypothetical protein
MSIGPGGVITPLAAAGREHLVAGLLSRPMVPRAVPAPHRPAGHFRGLTQDARVITNSMVLYCSGGHKSGS